jgi:cytochrome P450
MNGVIMLAAGHETTANMISLGTLALLEHPDAFARLHDTDDPAEVAMIVEELIRAGETVLMNLPAGNYDPAFVERPDAFDAGRGTRGHLGFGFGVHQCLGANLARVEMQVALSTLARRLPGLRLVVPAEQLTFQNTKEIYGVTELPVTW